MKILRHPSLMLTARHGVVAASQRHLEMELGESSRLWGQTWNTDVDAITKLFGSKICYRAGILYGLCRLVNPTAVVETGVANGVSSAFILQALEDNRGNGLLYSIDLPNVEYELDKKYILGSENRHKDILPEGKGTGYLVPAKLKRRWKLVLGDAREELQSLLGDIGEIDLFFHDSMHTYDHMMFEFDTVWPKLKTNGVLVSDDVDWNLAFSDFCGQHGMQPHLLGELGFAVKEE